MIHAIFLLVQAVEGSPQVHVSFSMFDRVILVIVTVVLSGFVSYMVSNKIAQQAAEKDDRKFLNERIDRLLDFSVTYPFLEDDDFAAGWDRRDPGDERYQRYDNYCCFLFNLLETLYKTQDGNTKRMHALLYYPELAHRHRYWWKSETVNSRGYPTDGFRRHINEEIESYDRNTYGGKH